MHPVYFFHGYVLTIIIIYLKILVNLWRKNRKLMNHTFNARNIDYFHEIFVAQSKKFINNLEEESGKEQTDDLMIKIWKRTLAASYGIELIHFTCTRDFFFRNFI